MSGPSVFDGNVIVISGAGAGGIGSAVSHALAGPDVRILAVDRTPELVNEACEQIRARGAEVHGIALDLTDIDQTAQVIATALDRFGQVDKLINIVGGTRPQDWCQIERTPVESVDEIVALNFRHVYQIGRDAARAMIKRSKGGAIVNIGSISAFAGSPYFALYGAQKAAVVSLTRSMSAEWRRYNIRVNCISPGTVMTRRLIEQGTENVPGLRDEGYGRRTVTAQEIANVAAFLLSDLASGVSSQNILVDGGVTGDFPGQSLRDLERKIYPDEVPGR